MRVTISGGEPMLRDDLFGIIRRFYDNGVSVILGTNGTFIQQENVRNLHMCTRVEISLDGGTKDINNRIRPSRQKSGDAWNETMNAIRLCVVSGINLRVLTALNAQNQHSLLAMAGILEYLGVTDWGISWTIPAGRVFPIYDQLRPQESVVVAQLEQIRQMHPGLHVRYSNRSVDYNRFYCLILPDGQMGTEDVNLGKKVYFGSLLHIPIASVWNSVNYNLSQHFEKWVGNRVYYTEK